MKPAAIGKKVVTRFGGDPDVPARFVWPKNGKVPLAFLAQYRMEELVAFDVDKKLPKKGLLSIFAQMNSEHFGYAEVAKAFYFDDAKKLARLTPSHGADDDGRPDKMRLATPSFRVTVPGPYEKIVATLGLTSEESDRYHDDVYNVLRPDDGGAHQLLGWGSGATMVSNKKGWEILAQIDSDDRLGLEIGDVETLRVYVETKNLAAKKLSSVRATCGEE